MMQRVQVGTPIVIGDVTITPVEKLSLNRSSGKSWSLAYLVKSPVGVIVDSPGGRQAFGVDGVRLPDLGSI